MGKLEAHIKASTVLKMNAVADLFLKLCADLFSPHHYSYTGICVHLLCTVYVQSLYRDIMPSQAFLEKVYISNINSVLW